jgi:hypothetical protein
MSENEQGVSERQVKAKLVETQLMPTSTKELVHASVDLEVDPFLFVDVRASMVPGKPAEIQWPWANGQAVQFREVQRRDNKMPTMQAAVEKELAKAINKKMADLLRRMQR